MNIETAYHILDLTVREGGATFDSDGGMLTRDRGYVVALKGGAIISVHRPALAVGAIIEIARLGYRYIGTWYSDEKYYIDIVAIVEEG